MLKYSTVVLAVKQPYAQPVKEPATQQDTAQTQNQIHMLALCEHQDTHGRFNCRCRFPIILTSQIITYCRQHDVSLLTLIHCSSAQAIQPSGYQYFNADSIQFIVKVWQAKVSNLLHASSVGTSRFCTPLLPKIFARQALPAPGRLVSGK